MRWGVGGVAGAAGVADDRAGLDVPGTDVGVGGEVGAVVVGAVVSGEPVGEAAETVVVVLDGAGAGGNDGGALGGEDVDTLMGASAGAGSTPGVGETDGPGDGALRRGCLAAACPG